MITPTAFHLIIKHINELDKRIASKLVSKKPWDEISLTSALTDLFDEETQVNEDIEYNVVKLNTDLKKDSGLIGLKLSMDATPFTATYERYVSQSDLGLQIILDNLIEPRLSWKKSYLLQAKRLKPKSINPVKYDESCSFSAMNKAQEDRIEILRKMIGESFLYLLYCPRPERIDLPTSEKLSYLRTQALSSDIFDYMNGLEIYSELSKSQGTIAAGIFTSNPAYKINNFGAVHRSIFGATRPLSWFIAMNLLKYQDPSVAASARMAGLVLPYVEYGEVSEEQKSLVEDIIAGKDEVIEAVKKKFPGKRLIENFTIYPKYTITLRYSIGENIDPDHRLLRSEQE